MHRGVSWQDAKIKSVRPVLVMIVNAQPVPPEFPAGPAGRSTSAFLGVYAQGRIFDIRDSMDPTTRPWECAV